MEQVRKINKLSNKTWIHFSYTDNVKDSSISYVLSNGKKNIVHPLSKHIQVVSTNQFPNLIWVTFNPNPIMELKVFMSSDDANTMRLFLKFVFEFMGIKNDIND